MLFKLQSDSNARNDQKYSPEHSYSKNGVPTEASLQTVTVCDKTTTQIWKIKLLSVGSNDKKFELQSSLKHGSTKIWKTGYTHSLKIVPTNKSAVEKHGRHHLNQRSTFHIPRNKTMTSHTPWYRSLRKTHHHFWRTCAKTTNLNLIMKKCLTQTEWHLKK